MPTGYTSKIYDGEELSLAEFATTCAHGMMAFIHQRDSSNDKLYYRSIDPYYEKGLKEALAEKLAFETSSEEDKYSEWSTYCEQAEANFYREMSRNSDMMARYNRLLVEIALVDVPPKMQSFKDFMIEQLNSSKKFDCIDESRLRDYYATAPYEEWVTDRYNTLERNVVRAQEQLDQEVKRVADQREYARLLSETFGVEVLEPSPPVC